MAAAATGDYRSSGACRITSPALASPCTPGEIYYGQDPGEKSGLGFPACGTVDAQRARGIDFQPSAGNLLSAVQAVAIVSRFNACQCASDVLHFDLAAAHRFLGHRLQLQCIHSRQPAHPCLIQFHSRRTLFARRCYLEQDSALLQQQQSEMLDIDHDSMLPFDGRRRLSSVSVFPVSIMTIVKGGPGSLTYNQCG